MKNISQVFNMSVAEKVTNRMNRVKKGVPFSISRFYGLGSETAVQKAFSRLTKQGVIERLSKGVYARPKPLQNFPAIKMSANAEQVAKHWAKERGYTLVNQGQESAYRLGLQSQAPVKPIYWSNGPSRQFRVGKQVVEVRHIAVSKLKWAGRPEGEFLRGLLVTPTASVEMRSLSNALKRLSVSGKEAKSLIHKLYSAPLPSEWYGKLKEFERTL